jgi:hypothetical protein
VKTSLPPDGFLMAKLHFFFGPWVPHLIIVVSTQNTQVAPAAHYARRRVERPEHGEFCREKSFFLYAASPLIKSADVKELML